MRQHRECPTCGDVHSVRYENMGDCPDPWHKRDSDPINDYADLLDAVQLLKRWTHKYPDTDLGIKTIDWLRRKQLQGTILR